MCAIFQSFCITSVGSLLLLLLSHFSRVRLEMLGLEEAQAGVKIARRNINNLRYANDTTLMAESEELKSLLMKVTPIPPSIRVFSNESTLRMRWPERWSFSFSIIPSKEIPGLISFRMDWLDGQYH